MKWLNMRYFIILLMAIMPASSAFSADYPNELAGFKLFDKYCHGLKPMKSTVEEMTKVLGMPMADKSGKYVFWYEKDGWNILVYFYPDNGDYPSRVAGKVVESIDFISTKPIAFGDTKFPKAFNTADVRAADAAWDEYYDAFGLVYEVYKSKPQYGDKGPGDLNRISYRAAPHETIRMQRFHIRDAKQGANVADPSRQGLLADVFFSPKGGCADAIIKEIKAAKTTVLVQAYWFTSESIAKALADAHNRGVKVQVILDRSRTQIDNDQAEFIVQKDVPTFIDDEHKTAHSKVIIVDGHTVITGSFNFTDQAEEENAENLLVIRDRSIAEKYTLDWKAHAKHSGPYLKK